MSSVYTTYVNNLHNFVDGIITNPTTKTNIHFLYFMQNNMTPKIKCTFGKWVLGSGSDINYVLPAIHDNFVYVYKPDSLKLLVDPYPNAPSPFNTSFLAHAPINTDFNVIIKGIANTPDPNEVYLGHHIDFGIIETRARKQIVKCHLTVYNLLANNTFDREAIPCNFTIQDVESLIPNYVNNITDFKTITCEYPPGSGSGQGHNMNTFCDPKWHNIIFNLTRIIKNLPQLGGNKLQKYSYNKKLYTVHYGKRGGAYILLNKRRKYLTNKQSGGTLEEERTKLLNSEEFSHLIYSTFYTPVNNNKKLESMQFIYDFKNEVSEKGNTNMVIIYEFPNNNCQMYYVNAEYIFHICESKSYDNLQQLSEKIVTMIKL